VIKTQGGQLITGKTLIKDKIKKSM